MNLTEMMNAVKSSEDLEGLRALNEQVVDRIKYLRSRRARDKVRTLSKGDRVRFTERGGGVYSGKVVRPKQTRVLVEITDTDGGLKWSVGQYIDVPAGMLEVLED